MGTRKARRGEGRAEEGDDGGKNVDFRSTWTSEARGLSMNFGYYECEGLIGKKKFPHGDRIMNLAHVMRIRWSKLRTLSFEHVRCIPMFGSWNS